VADLDRNLDPYTLRAIAREASDRALTIRASCPCYAHAALADDADALAAELRTVAIRLEQNVPGALSANQPTPDGGTGGSALVTGPSAPANPETDDGGTS